MQPESIIVFALAAFFYLLPAINASSRRHHNSGAIWMLTLITGWTGWGWLVALIWSCTAVRRAGYV